MLGLDFGGEEHTDEDESEADKEEELIDLRMDIHGNGREVHIVRAEGDEDEGTGDEQNRPQGLVLEHLIHLTNSGQLEQGHQDHEEECRAIGHHAGDIGHLLDILQVSDPSSL